MNPDLLLGIVTALMDFMLKTILGFGVCLVLSLLVDSPSRRFIVWLSFVYGTAAYWLWLAREVLVPIPMAATISHLPVPPETDGAGVLHIPGSWALPLGLAMRGMGFLYLLVLTYMLVTHIRQHLRLRWILGFTSEPPGEISAAFRPLAEKLGVRRARLRILSGVSSPATFGWIQPIILLPDICLEQHRSDLEGILRHELHHVRRWDFAWNGVATACRALLFFHPAAWYAVKRMQFDRELACDLAAVPDSPTGRAKYAESLIQFARISSTQDAMNWGIDFAASSAHLKVRVHSILAEKRRLSAWLVWPRTAFGLALLAGFFAVEPSFRVLLFYAQQQIAQPLVSDVVATPARAATRVRATNRGRLLREQTTAAPEASVSETAPPADFSAAAKTEGSASSPGGGPQLLHRGAGTPGSAAKQQTVLIDDASGHVSKAGDHDHAQVLQQAETAAAILKQLSTLDRH